MVQGYPEDEAKFQAQDSPHARQHMASIGAWIDSVSLAGASDPHQLEVRCTEEPGRALTSVPRHINYLPQTETQKGCTGVVNASIMPVCCYRLLNDGFVVVSEGHPFVCACARNGRLHAKDSTYVSAMPVYRTLPTAIHLIDKRQKYLNIMMLSCTEACYPFERFGVMSYNPFHHAKQRDSITREPLALEPILVAGAAMDMLHHGDFQLSMLESSVAYILRMINEIRESTTIPYHQTALEKQLTFHALGCITAVSWSTGDLVLWHKHMKLLRQHLEKSGFLLTADPHDMMKVRMADIEGAVIAGVAPSLPYSRQYPLLPCVLPVQDVLLILTKLRPPLQACNVDSDTVDSILAVCIFISTMQMSQEYGLEEKFDPENLMEDYDFLQRDLLTLPQPLGTNMKDTASTTWPSYDGGLSAAMKPSLAFEEAIRVTTLMCLRAANIQAPWSKATYSKLLDILVDRLRVILDWMYESKEDCAFIDPSLLHHREEGFPVNNARRFLIWICMIGYELSVYYTVYHEGWSDHRRKSCLYLQMLGALGIHDEADIDNSDNEELSIFDTINLNWATNNKWQARDMLKWMIK